VTEFADGELILLVDKVGRRHRVRLKAGQRHSLHSGAIEHDALIGRQEGVVVTTQLGARLAKSPPRITLTFDEAVTPAQGGIELRRIGGGAAPTIGKAATTNGGKTLEIRVGHLSPGVYEASWQIIADDGHFEAGALDFQVGNVGHLIALPTTPQTPLPWSLVVARLVLYAGLALTFGRAIVALRLHHRFPGSHGRTIAPARGHRVVG